MGLMLETGNEGGGAEMARYAYHLMMNGVES
jgi:hypothetical protein